MTMSSSNEFTQKDLMKHLLDVSQHAVTREQLQETERNLNRRIDEVRSKLVEVRTELKQDIDDVRAELKQDIAGVRGEVKEVHSKLDRMQWAICGTIIVGAATLLFKEQILMALLS
ncbi:hypothetical protein MKR81_27870 (plasmid) [Vibrio campbellii]|uniref:hypothetical protein n=1 Tax=Vibrio campbellii TaxID=680 RepID=UPI001F071985|nr:hypothetical protein [Vibrio campbellii]UMM06980.1 hypothetical protein MKR81_27870 [Vibrio campbellii]